MSVRPAWQGAISFPGKWKRKRHFRCSKQARTPRRTLLSRSPCRGCRRSCRRPHSLTRERRPGIHHPGTGFVLAAEDGHEPAGRAARPGTRPFGAAARASAGSRIRRPSIQVRRHGPAGEGTAALRAAVPSTAVCRPKRARTDPRPAWKEPPPPPAAVAGPRHPPLVVRQATGPNENATGFPVAFLLVGAATGPATWSRTSGRGWGACRRPSWRRP
jgi:hypothetical protein